MIQSFDEFDSSGNYSTKLYSSAEFVKGAPGNKDKFVPFLTYTSNNDAIEKFDKILYAGSLGKMFRNSIAEFPKSSFLIVDKSSSSNNPVHPHCSIIWLVTQFGVFLTFKKYFISGCFTSIVNIRAPLLPLCPIRPVVNE